VGEREEGHRVQISEVSQSAPTTRRRTAHGHLTFGASSELLSMKTCMQ
jgi:hypothetical protein